MPNVNQTKDPVDFVVNSIRFECLYASIQLDLTSLVNGNCWTARESRWEIWGPHFSIGSTVYNPTNKYWLAVYILNPQIGGKWTKAHGPYDTLDAAVLTFFMLRLDKG